MVWKIADVLKHRITPEKKQLKAIISARDELLYLGSSAL
jgi:hypothetical protein